jgi:phenylacetate-CoA ligase
MAEVAKGMGVDIYNSDVSRIIVAGEPGGSVPAIRSRIESAWNARVVDHSGATEVGPWGYADKDGLGLHIVESEFIAEFVSVETGREANDGELSQLILTSLGRYGCPVIRYQTGDLVRPFWREHSSAANRFVFLDGGVLGRADDMMIIRGVNIFPSSIEQILSTFPEITEYRLTATKSGEMDALQIEIEGEPTVPVHIANEIKLRLGLSVQVTSVAVGALPRFEAKGQRFVDKRKLTPDSA